MNDGDSEFWTTPEAGYEDVVNINRAKNGREGKDNGFDFQLDYVRPFEDESKLEVGLKSTLRTRDESQLAFQFDQTIQSFIPDESYNNRFLYDENIHVYAGPGCKRGLKHLFGNDKKSEKKIKILFIL